MHFDGVKGLKLLPEIQGLKRNYSYYPVIFQESFGMDRNQIADKLSKNNIFGRKYFYPLTSKFSCYKGKFNAQLTPIAEDISKRVLCLPMYADLALEDVDRICNIILNR